MNELNYAYSELSSWARILLVNIERSKLVVASTLDSSDTSPDGRRSRASLAAMEFDIVKEPVAEVLGFIKAVENAIWKDARKR